MKAVVVSLYLSENPENALCYAKMLFLRGRTVIVFLREGKRALSELEADAAVSALLHQLLVALPEVLFVNLGMGAVPCAVPREP